MLKKMAAILSLMALSVLPSVGHAAPFDGVRGGGTFTGALAGGGFTVLYECHAVATTAVAATRVDACYLKNPANGAVIDSAQPRALPGNASVVIKIRRDVTVVPQVCWRVSAVWLDNRTASTSGCASSVGGSGGALPKAGTGSSFGAAQ